MQAPFQYTGSKWRMKNFVLSHFPEHKTYAEAFCGSAVVLMNKPKSDVEAINDLHSGIVSFFRVLQDPEKSKILENRIANTLYSYDEFCLALKILSNDESSQEDTAWALYTSQNQGFGGKAKTRGNWGVALRDDRTPLAWTNRKTHIGEWRDRMSRVFVDNRDAIDFIKKWDSEDTLHYLDPPYPMGVRKEKKIYNHDTSDDLHERVVDAVKNAKGMVILSSYRNDLYDSLLGCGWGIAEKESCASSVGRGRNFMSKRHDVGEMERRTEALYLSPSAIERTRK